MIRTATWAEGDFGINPGQPGQRRDLFQPDWTSRILFAFNPLEYVVPDCRYLVASGMISVLKKVWADFWGPRLEHILRNSLLTLLENPGSTLLDVPKLLTDDRFREAMLRRVTHPQVREFWLSEFAKYSAWASSGSHVTYSQ